MKKLLFGKIKESLFSVLPVTLIVIILNFTPLLNLELKEIIVFSISALFLILGIGLFTLGADVAMTPMGERVGAGLTKSKNLGLLLIVGFAMGLLITIAEPDLTVLANQVGSSLIIIFVGLGVGLFLLLAILKIVFKIDLSTMLLYFYMVLFALGLLGLTLAPEEFSKFIPLSFDSGGVTTGPITVPFIMALGVGIALSIGGKNSSENSFGLVAMCSIGPILAVLVMSILNGGNVAVPKPEDYLLSEDIFSAVLHTLSTTTKDVTIALGLVVLSFFVINFIFLKLPKQKLMQIIVGALYTYVGLIVFLTAVHVGFMPIGFKMGSELASSPIAVIIIAFILGLVVVLAEPAVHVLNKQVEEITNGTVSKKAMMIALSIGVGLSICLSVIRIIYGFSVLYYLIPGYLISLGLSFFVPKIYTAIAFDSGGVASGPLTSTFILPFAIGICYALGGDILADAFGIVAMVAMTPLITIQLLGFTAVSKKRVNEKLAMRKILGEEDDQIIRFL